MRVVSGALGGRPLVAPRGRHTRPTSERVREALFSMLGRLDDVAVLDLYAGSGALGIEALSRGAARATFVERAGPALAALRTNLQRLALVDRATVLATPVARALTAVREGGFGLVLADPPYADLESASEALAKLVNLDGAVDLDARIVLEHASRDAAPTIAGVVLERTRKYGDSALSCYVVAPPSVPVPDC